MPFPHLYPTVAATTLLLWAIMVHLVCDWLLQNEWMAREKTRVGGAASLVHAGIHTLGLLLIFPPGIAVGVGAAHATLDGRRLLTAWGRLFRQTSDAANPVSLHVALWRDQVAHLVILAIVSYFLGR